MFFDCLNCGELMDRNPYSGDHYCRRCEPADSERRPENNSVNNSREPEWLQNSRAMSDAMGIR